MLTELVLELVVKDIKKEVEFYNKYFGFEIELISPDDVNYTWIQLSNNNIKIMMQDFNETQKEIQNFPDVLYSSNLVVLKYDRVDEIKKIYESLISDKIKMFMDMKETDYGAVIFGVFDSSGNMILLSAKK